MNKDELRIIKLLQNIGESLTPKKSSLGRLLQNMTNEDVTKEDYLRYNYSKSMNWKFAAPIFLVVLLLVGFFAFKNLSKNVIQPSNQTAQTSQSEIPQVVTAQNADETLSKTDIALNQDLNQLDQDLKDIDNPNNQEEDPNSL
ncbi:hypothetical protein M1437_03765 [Patescibacteria group bacterium]|nr:hypothetical protein [Patescibacteria group bacterium]